MSFPAPTAPRKREYNPLRPFCIRSPAKPLLSEFDDEGGGDANSLKVVRVSERLAELCILSKAWASCSLSIGVEPESDARDARREPKPSVLEEGGPTEDCGESWDAMINLHRYYI